MESVEMTRSMCGLTKNMYGPSAEPTHITVPDYAFNLGRPFFQVVWSVRAA